MLDLQNKLFKNFVFSKTENDARNQFDDYFLQISTPILDRKFVDSERYFREKVFMDKHLLKESKSNSYPKWSFFKKEFSAGHHNDYRNNKEYEFLSSSAICDHTRLYYIDRNSYVFATQPYSLTWDLFYRFYILWTSQDLYVNLSNDNSWWYPGWTSMVTLSNFDFQFVE